MKNQTCQVLRPILDIKTDDNKTLGQIREKDQEKVDAKAESF